MMITSSEIIIAEIAEGLSMFVVFFFISDTSDQYGVFHRLGIN